MAKHGNGDGRVHIVGIKGMVMELLKEVMNGDGSNIIIR